MSREVSGCYAPPADWNPWIAARIERWTATKRAKQSNTSPKVIPS